MISNLTISQSSLERARDTGDNSWLEATFNKADEIVRAGGKVNITQEFSDASTELVAIIDSRELLDYYKRKYMKDQMD